MKPVMKINTSSTQPDLALLERLHWLHQICIGITFLIALIVLCGWMLPGFSQWLPEGWQLMQATTALCIYLAGGSMLLSFSRSAPAQRRQSRVIAMLLIVIAGLAFWDYVMHNDSGISSLLPVINDRDQAGRMSVHMAIYLMLLGCCLLLTQQRKNALSLLSDSLTMGLMVVTVLILAGYIFNAVGLFAESETTRASPHTLICMVLLTFVHVGRRAESGFFSVLVGVGIGSRIARLVLPIVLLVPFLMPVIALKMASQGWMSASVSTALATIAGTMLLFSLMVWMSWHINTLERDLREMSLTDETTQIYNRRGFELFAGQALREARRAGAEVAVLFFDLDELKSVNDRLGHDSGTAFIREFATVLRQNFRDSDIIGRLGGDEFAVLTYGQHDDIVIAQQRLQETIETRNRHSTQAYALLYSVGLATEKARADTSIEALLREADRAMYVQKQQHHQQRAAAVG